MSANFSDLLGATLTQVSGAEYGSDEVMFCTDDGRQYRQYHYQDCCENVSVEDVVGDVSDLIGSPIVEAEEVTREGEDGDCESYTWTFYKLRTVKGCVVIRWLGRSNGYYSEAVYFERVTP